MALFNPKPASKVLPPTEAPTVAPETPKLPAQRKRPVPTLTSAIASVVTDISTVATNMLIKNTNIKSGYYARETPRTTDFLDKTLPRLHEAIVDRTEYATRIVTENMEEFEKSLDMLEDIEKALQAIPEDQLKALGLDDCLMKIGRFMSNEQADPVEPATRQKSSSLSM
jgi:hypothetical protein